MDEMLFNNAVLQTDDDAGSVTAVVGKLEVVDLKGDLVKRGAFPNGQEVLISDAEHNSAKASSPPVGRGTLHADGDDIIFRGKFNLNMNRGKEAYESVKFNGDLQQWSFGAHVRDSQRVTQNKKSVRVVNKLDFVEVSPVLVGAGLGTRTLEVKSIDEDNKEILECDKIDLLDPRFIISRSKLGSNTK